ncbi:hypothetical protein HHI36_010499 [Cryptolaemus montrouzieri]|uniref:Uncharacterized protein n=1 Tax=Cryptolaemus montrouzieri TaxID=559131 RepID=A0ABD2MJN6_9CUCU
MLNNNIQCLRYKVDAVNYLLSEENCDIAFITEHWLSQDEMQHLSFSKYVVADDFSRLSHTRRLTDNSEKGNRPEIVNWKSLIVPRKAKNSFSNFHETILEHFNTIFPEKRQLFDPKKSKVRNYPVINSLKSKLDAAHTIWRVRNDDPCLQLYRKLKNRYKNAIDQEVKPTNHSYIANHTNKSRAIWQVEKYAGEYFNV